MDGDRYAKFNFSPEFTKSIRNLIDQSVRIMRGYQVLNGDFEESIIQQSLLNQRIRTESRAMFEDGMEILYIPAGRSLLATLSEQLADVKISEMDLAMQDFIKKIRETRSKFGSKIPEMIQIYLKTVKGQIKNNSVDMAYALIHKILKADYLSDRDGEKLSYNEHDWVKLMYSSSGQQEVLWMLNLMFTIILENKKTFLVVEEPEAHLFPNAQMEIMELVALTINSSKSEVLITTHSPYILTALNLLIFSAKVENCLPSHAPRDAPVVEKMMRINPNAVAAYKIDIASSPK